MHNVETLTSTCKWVHASLYSYYPRSNGLCLFLPQRQTIVLLTDRTIRELCSSTTPTSQFSSLHFIASKAIEAKSIERRAQAQTQTLGWKLGGKAPTFGARRVLAQTAGQPLVCYARALRWLFDFGTGGWRLKHAPLPLPYCYVMGARPRNAKALR